jgi:hypothetical protein
MVVTMAPAGEPRCKLCRVRDLDHAAA